MDTSTVFKRGNWSDAEILDLIRNAQESQWFTSGEIRVAGGSNIDQIKDNLKEPRSADQIKRKFSVVYLM